MRLCLQRLKVGLSEVRSWTRGQAIYLLSDPAEPDEEGRGGSCGTMTIRSDEDWERLLED